MFPGVFSRNDFIAERGAKRRRRLRGESGQGQEGRRQIRRRHSCRTVECTHLAISALDDGVLIQMLLLTLFGSIGRPFPVVGGRDTTSTRGGATGPRFGTAWGLRRR